VQGVTFGYSAASIVIASGGQTHWHM
jgi:hypothetical protein